MKKIRIATFNLYQFAVPPMAWYEKKNSYKDTEWSVKKEWITSQIQNMDADIVGFQEVFSPDELKELMSQIGLNHFTTVDTPGHYEEDDTIFNKPIVALASKYPIIESEALIVDDIIRKDLPVSDDFKFSRTPIKAVINIEGYSPLTVLVAHLKSKRPIIEEPVFDENDNWNKIVLESLRIRSRGQVAALLQRAAEAAALYHKATSIMKDSNNPVIVLGDLNDDSHSIPIEALTNRGHIFEINGIHSSKLPFQAKSAIYDYKLYNSFDLAPNPSGEEQKPTHYYNNIGNVLDYILVSNALNESNFDEKGRVVSHTVYDSHLHADGVGNHKQSDHAQVAMEIKLFK